MTGSKKKVEKKEVKEEKTDKDINKASNFNNKDGGDEHYYII